MLAVCRAGDAYFREVLAKYGRATVLEATGVYMEQSERRTRHALAKIPSGVYRAVGHFDNDGITLDRPVRVEIAITVGDGGMTVDFAGSDPQVKGPFNCGDAITISACRMLIKCLTTPLDPVDEGCFRPLTVVIPPRSVLAAQEPAPTARYYVPVNLLLDLGLRALAPAMPDAVPAGSYGDQMPTIAFGTHPETGRLFIQGDRKATQHPIAAGETVRIMTGGGGGFGPPSERDPEAVRRDVREGYISPAAARRDYGSATRARSD